LRISRSLAITVALGAGLLIPVLVIISLGIYGESIGLGHLESTAGGPSLSAQPDSDRSDSAVRIEGASWPPGAEVFLFLSDEQSGVAGGNSGVPLTTATASATGRFVVQLNLSRTLLAAVGPHPQILAEVRRAGREPISSIAIDLDIRPYTNVVSVAVVDAESGTRLSDADVLLRGSFGIFLASARTGDTGIAEFAGIAAGNAVAEVRKVDYQRASIELSVPPAGLTQASVSLPADPGKRLLLPFRSVIDEAHLRTMVLDRASGLRADEVLNSKSGNPPEIVGTFPAEVHFFYLLPNPSSNESLIRPSETPSVETMRAWGLQFASHLRAIVARVSLLGLSADGDVVMVMEATGAGFGRGSSTWLLLDPATGRERRRGELPQGSLVAGLSSDRSGLYVIDNSRNRLSLIPVVTGVESLAIPELPPSILRLSPDPSGSAVYVLQAGTGNVFRVDWTMGAITGPIVSVVGATWLAADHSGTQLYLVGPGLESVTVVSDPDGLSTLGIAPLPGSASWIWVDSDGPYLYTGGGAGMDVSVLDAETLEIVGRYSTETLDSQSVSGTQSASSADDD
jgi:hypothetical protein